MTDILTRAMPAEVNRLDRSTLEIQFVPWDRAAKVVDPTERGFDVYMEGFRRTAFDSQVSSSEPGVVRRIGFRDQHHDGLGKLGHTVGLAVGDGGLVGTVKLLRSRIDDVEDLLDMGVDQVSIEFFPKRGGTSIDDAGTRWRTAAHLTGVALEAQGAYGDGARVLAMREDREAEAAEVEAEQARERQLAELDAYLASERDRFAHLRA